MINPKEFSLDKLCRWYLIHSYLYYKLDSNVIPDTTFDEICKLLLESIKEIPEEWNVFVTKDNLEAGTGFNIDFIGVPQRVKDVAHIFHTGKDFSGNKINLKEWLK